MKKIFAAIAFTIAATSAQAEIAYDYKNPEHKIDNRCVSVVSFARDLLFNDVQINGDGSVLIYTIEPTADVQKARSILGDLSNAFILKYEYSKQFNDHYRAWKSMVRSRTNEQGPEYLNSEIEKCMDRI